MKLFGSPMPSVVIEKCNGCGTCVKNCPAQAMAVVGKKCRIETKKCIACFCCHEVCEQGAIEIKKPFMMRQMEGTEEKIVAGQGL